MRLQAIQVSHSMRLQAIQVSHSMRLQAIQVSHSMRLQAIQVIKVSEGPHAGYCARIFLLT